MKIYFRHVVFLLRINEGHSGLLSHILLHRLIPVIASQLLPPGPSKTKESDYSHHQEDQTNYCSSTNSARLLIVKTGAVLGLNKAVLMKQLRWSQHHIK